MKMENQTISLCMIVRDEEELLSDCLKSADGVTDEIIIVDTGSKDKTKEIAREYNAKIIDYPWNDNFSDARNESLKNATGDWILVLDADERLLEKDKTKIKEIIRDKSISGVNLKILVKQTNENIIPAYLSEFCRLFRNIPEIRYQRAVHEQILPSIIRINGKIVESDIVIVHLGYSSGEEIQRRKQRRNLEILKKTLEVNPEDAYGLFCLGMTYHAMGKIEKAIRVLSHALRIENNPLREELRRVSHVKLSQCYLGIGAIEIARHHAMKAISFSSRISIPTYVLACIEFRKCNFSESLKLLKDIESVYKRKKDSLIDEFIDIAQVYVDKGNCYYRLGEYSKATLEYSNAILHNPGMAVAFYNMGNSLFKNGQMKDAINAYYKALDIDPSLEVARMNIGRIYQMMSRDSGILEKWAVKK